MARERVVRVYQEDWWPFRNLPAALRRFSQRTGIATELVWDKVGVGTIETMFAHMVRSFTADDPPFDLVCTDEVMLRRFAAEGRVLPLNRLMERGRPRDEGRARRPRLPGHHPARRGAQG